jgi:H+/Cl- antiporter ClcA
MSGLNIYKYFSFQTYIAKAIGLIAGMTAGLSVGREGPYVHMSACIANKLSKLSYFRDIEKN